MSSSESVRNKISKTLKDKYKSGEIVPYKQQHLWIKTFIYNVRTIKLEAVCDCRQDALRLLHGYKCANPEKTLYYNRYCISSENFTNYNDLANYINKNFLVANSKFGKYIIIEDDNNIKYYRNLKECARENSLNKSTLMKHSNASKDSPYFIKNKHLKFYYSNEYIDVKYAAVPIEKSLELLSGNIGEGCDANPEISIDSNEFIPS